MDPRVNRQVLNEYLLQGSISESNRETLLNRLKGLCDMAESTPEKFIDHEMVYSLKAPAPARPVVLALRCPLDRKEEPWHLRYVGQSETGDQTKHTMIRNFVDSSVSSDIVHFLPAIGFTKEYEYVSKGYIFRKGCLKVTVSKLNKLASNGNVDCLEALSSTHLVELSVVAAQGSDRLQDDLRNFAAQLKPLVNLEKIDHRKIIQNVQSQMENS